MKIRLFAILAFLLLAIAMIPLWALSPTTTQELRLRAVGLV